jgi:cytochrome b subunit of formate dehydrogenase
MRQTQRVFHLAMALVFLFLAVSGGSVALEMWEEHRHKAGGGIVGLTVMAAFAALLMIFSLYSFAKARSVR